MTCASTHPALLILQGDSMADSIFASPEDLMYFYNEALRINAEQLTQLEKLKRQVNDQAQVIQQYQDRFGDIKE